MKKILIWDCMISGHHVEYIHHIYEIACNDPENQYIFSIQEKFDKLDEKLVWGKKQNISFDFVKESDNRSITQKNKSIINKISKNKPDVLLLINIMDIFPFVPFVVRFMGIKTKICGILYDIYLYKWKKFSPVKKIKNIFFYSTFKLQRNIERVWVLNDETSEIVLNKIWKTNKFQFIPDPIPIEKGSSQDNSNTIHNQKTNILHCGSLSRRKGTLDILDAMKYIEEDKNSRTYYFLGRINKEIEKEFDERVKSLSKDHKIIANNSFCEFTELKKHFNAINYLILPYKETSKSSGLIGYAALYNKHVVIPEEGMLKRIVKRYKLGSTIKEITPKKIADFICKNDKTVFHISGKRYVDSHRILDFQNVIKKAID